MATTELKNDSEVKHVSGGPRPVSYGMEAVVHNQKGTKSKIKLPEHIFGLPWNSDLVHQVAVSMTSSARQNVAHVKTRGEVRGGGKKPWQQKGTGRARHGSTRSPIWVGGGVTHGPRNDKNYDRKVNRKMKAKALFTILSRKYKDGEVFFVDYLDLKESKTKEGVAALKALSKAGLPSISDKHSNAIYIALGEKNEKAMKSLRNVGNVSVQETRNMNPVSLMQYKSIFIVNPEESLKTLESKMNVPKEKKEGEIKAKKTSKSKTKAVKAKAKVAKSAKAKK
jgi:large subunit ribosomal protein L4